MRTSDLTSRAAPADGPALRKSHPMNVLCMSSSDATALEGVIVDRGWGNSSRKGRVVTFTCELDALFRACAVERVRLESVEVMPPPEVTRR